MTVKELVEVLKQLSNQDAIVVDFEGDEIKYVEIEELNIENRGKELVVVLN